MTTREVMHAIIDCNTLKEVATLFVENKEAFEADKWLYKYGTTRMRHIAALKKTTIAMTPLTELN